jgi:hybrid cluster-associated redox disulfide protein
MRKKPEIASQIHSQWITSDLIQKHPETVSVFVRNRMACPGCPLSSFDSLEAVMKSYGLDPRKFLGQLRKAVRGKRTNQ